MKKQQLNKSAKKAKVKALEKKQFHSRLAKPEKLKEELTTLKKEDSNVEHEANANRGRSTSNLSADQLVEHSQEPINHMDTEKTEDSPEAIAPERKSVHVGMGNIGSKAPIKEPEKDTDINLADSGFFEPVIEREYAEKPQVQVPEAPKLEAQAVVEPVKPKIVFAPKLTLQTDDTYKKVMGDNLKLGNSDAQIPENPVPDDGIPTMQYQEASFDISDNADSLGRQMGQEACNTTSEWAFGMLENFYPEVVAFFTKIPTDWIEKAKLPNNLEAEILQKILTANNKNKNRVKISDFHKKNILPPLKRILEKKGWENVMPDELLLVIGLVVLAADSFFKIGEIKKENKVLEKQIKQKIQEFIDIRTEERKEIDTLKGELSDMRAFMAQFRAAQAHNRLLPNDNFNQL